MVARRVRFCYHSVTCEQGRAMSSGTKAAKTKRIASLAKGEPVRVKDRIYSTACNMFFKNGIRDVCVDAIATEAGSNKMSFYRSFASKDDLVAEFLRDQERDYWEWWDSAIAACAGDARAQLDALMEAYVKKGCSVSISGCALGNAAVELRDETHPGYAIVRGYKAETRRRLRKLAREALATDPDKLGDALQLIMEGGYMTRLTFDGADSPFAQTAAVAKMIIDLHCGPRP